MENNSDIPDYLLAFQKPLPTPTPKKEPGTFQKIKNYFSGDSEPSGYKLPDEVPQKPVENKINQNLNNSDIPDYLLAFQKPPPKKEVEKPSLISNAITKTKDWYNAPRETLEGTVSRITTPIEMMDRAKWTSELPYKSIQERGAEPLTNFKGVVEKAQAMTDVAKQAMKPLAPMPTILDRLKPDVVKKIDSRVMGKLAETADSFFTQDNIEMAMLPGGLQKVVAAKFVPDMVRGAAEEATDAIENFKKGDYPEAAASTVGALMNTGFAVLAGKHAVSPESVVPRPKTESPPEVYDKGEVKPIEPITPNPVTPSPDVKPIQLNDVAPLTTAKEIPTESPPVEPIKPLYTREQLQADLQKKAYQSKEQAKVIVGINDVVANAWAKRTGRPAEDWYTEHLGGFEEGGKPTGGALKQEEAPIFYSQLQKTLEEKMPNKASPEQVRGIIKTVKPEEVEWSGLNDFLNGKSSVSKQELLNHLKENEVKIEEIVKGTSKLKVVENKEEAEYSGAPAFDVVDPSGRVRFTGDADGVKKYIEEESQVGESKTKFSNYQEPGGENYRELLLTLPNKAKSLDARRAEIEKLGKNATDADKAEWASIMNQLKPDNRDIEGISRYKGNGFEEFKSSHFEEPNILAHVRFNDRMTYDRPSSFVESQGNKPSSDSLATDSKFLSDTIKSPSFLEKGMGGLDIENQLAVQTSMLSAISDSEVRNNIISMVPVDVMNDLIRAKLTPKEFFHNKTMLSDSLSRNPNAAVRLSEDSITGLIRSTAELAAKRMSDSLELARPSIDGNIAPSTFNNHIPKRTLFIEELQSDWAQKQRKGENVPSAPFISKTNTWVELALKRILRYAADNGYEKIAWTTGDQQAARYDLSKQVDYVRVVKSHDGTYTVSATKNGDEVIKKPGLNSKDIENYIGKELAQKAVNEADRAGDAEFSGNGLKVGGEGMKGFYDQILPSSMNKLVKKYGGRVGESNLTKNHLDRFEYVGPDLTKEQLIEKSKSLNNATYERQLRNIIREYDNGSYKYNIQQNGSPGLAEFLGGELRIPTFKEKIHSVDLPQELKQSVKQGQPLFQKDGAKAKGWVEFQKDGKAIIHAMKSFDVSTGIHELAHVWRRTLEGDVLKSLEDSLGVKDGKWKREHEEAFAKAAEKFASGKSAPTPELASLFTQFREWLKDIYKGARGLNVKISKEMQEAFNWLFGKEELSPELKVGLENLRNEMGKSGLKGNDLAVINNILSGKNLTGSQWDAWFKIKDRLEGQKVPPKLEPPKEPPPSIGPSEGVSRVYERLKEEFPDDLQENVTYTKMNMMQNAKEALDLVEKDPGEAYRRAMGDYPEGASEASNVAVSIALAEKARLAGNAELFSQLTKIRTLEQTARGQAIVAEKGSVSANSVARYVKELLRNRMENVGKSYFDFTKKSREVESRVGKATKAIEKEIVKTQEKIKKISSKEMDLSAAQRFIDKLACK